ncbi:glycosyl hydrolase 115 family protein [Rugosimonospora africana]|uniref:glycosyl hydrolase 115 family protein n=1 Tax=Rugosimonospora africana TaxID=556532 RepID=UPI001EF286E7|nr:glycosyl hydrolase 115 family protein [Rugosimonospora africana]
MADEGVVSRRDVLRGAGAAAAALTVPALTPALTPGVAAAAPAKAGAAFPLVAAGRATPLMVSGQDHPGVVRVAGDLRADIGRVTGVEPEVGDRAAPARDIVLIGTVGRSPLVDALVRRGRLDVSEIAGRWECSLREVVTDPFPGVRRALVLAGSDQRGTIYAAYDVSREIGVSPWYFWDDVPPAHRPELSVRSARTVTGEPAVKYRGFFINDENPNLGTWAPRYFGPGLAPGYPGGFNSKVYAAVFEALLRLRGNYLWPAVWGRAFAEDDPDNHAVATAYGVVMGTSHEAPMMRGIEEWNRHAHAAVRDSAGNIVTPGSDPYGGTGEWSFRHNAEAVTAYWRDGIQRMVDQHFEGVVTIGMRGNGDTALPDGNGIELMEDIVATQRRILTEVTGRDPAATPQVWTLYKEVQRYWDQGMAVPDDVTLVFADDNWGNLRKLPDPALPRRSGGYGIYYHFDYVGGGRNYKWVDTTLLPNVWEQLHQVYAYGVSQLWVVNVGDLKGNELALQFFLDYAWAPDALDVDRIPDWERDWASLHFGQTHAAAIATILHTYSRLASRRKPELLNRRITSNGTSIVYDDQASPFSLVNYRELETVTQQWQQLAADTAKVRDALPDPLRDAYFELVGYQVLATANLYALRLAEFTNLLYAGQGRAATNDLAATAEARLADDFALADHYNTAVAGGKWRDFQLQPHVDYGDVARYGPNAPWQEPEDSSGRALPDVIFPAVRRIAVPDIAELGVAVDGSDQFWLAGAAGATLPEFSPYQSQPAQYIEVFNRGTVPFDYAIQPAAGWLTVSPAHGWVDTQVRATVRVDWRRAPAGTTTVPIVVTGPGGASVLVRAVVRNASVRPSRTPTHVEANGYVSIEADHVTTAVHASGVHWRRIPDIGRTGSGMKAFPVTAPAATPGPGCPRLEYRLQLFTTGPVVVWAYLSPRNNVLHGAGIRYAVSFDDDPPQIVNVTTAAPVADDGTMNRPWERNTSDNVNRTSTAHTIATAGPHVLRFWMVDPTVVLQKLVVDTGGVAESYLGPPESLRLGDR